MTSRMAQNRRLINVFGRSSGTITLNVDRGGDLSLMTRLNLIRVWRDGSVLFIGFLVSIFLVTGLAQSSGQGTQGLSINLLQGGTWPIAILALNWCYYERANLWLPVVGGKALTTYFKGLMFSLMIIGLIVSAVMLSVLVAVGKAPTMSDVAFMAGALVGDSVVATMLLTRIKVQPGAFSPGLLVVLFVTFIAGAVVGFTASLLVGAIGGSSTVLIALQGVVTAVFAGVVAFVGATSLGGLVKGFEFS